MFSTPLASSWSAGKDPFFPSLPDGYELPSDGRQKVFPNGTLIIDQAMKSTDEGYYTCTAFSRRDEAHSGNVHIQVMSKRMPDILYI